MLHLSGIVVGSVVAHYDGNYQAGFICAGIGMVLSLIIQFLFAQKLLGNIGTVPAAKLEKQQQTEVRKEPLTSS